MMTMNCAASDPAIADGRRMFEFIADAAPVMIWQSGPDKSCTYFNKLWLEFTGRSVEQEVGLGWADGVHASDLQRCLDTYCAAFDAHLEYEMEYRLRRHDGEYRWVLDRGRPLLAVNGDFLGYIGGCIDITDRKRKESERQVRIQDHALQTFFVISLVARAALAGLPPASVVEPSAAALAEVLELASTGTARIRDLIEAENQTEVAERGFLQALRRLIDNFQQRTGIDAALNVTGSTATLPTEVAERLHAVARQALVNVEGSSKSSPIVLGLRVGRQSVSLSLQDDLGFTLRARLPLRPPE